MKAKKAGAKATKTVKKQPVVKAAAKPAKAAAPKAQKSAATKSSVKKNVKAIVSKKAPAAPAKPSKKPAAKTSGAGFSITAAANKLKNALTKVTKPAAKTPEKPTKSTKPIAAPAKANVPKMVPPQPVVTKARAPAARPVTKAYISPKGVLAEEDIRRMSEKDYMNDAQLEFFRHRLLQMRNEVLERELDVKERLHQREVFADPADRATAEEEHWLDLRLRERESLLLHKIDEALRRIADKEYGYCEKTGDPIGIPRLLARPTATVCVDVKGQDERIESQFRDR